MECSTVTMWKLGVYPGGLLIRNGKEKCCPLPSPAENTITTKYPQHNNKEGEVWTEASDCIFPGKVLEI